MTSPVTYAQCEVTRHNEVGVTLYDGGDMPIAMTTLNVETAERLATQLVAAANLARMNIRR